MAAKEYTCAVCGKTAGAEPGAPVPECCGELMVQAGLERCIQPSNAEHARSTEEDDACDDGRAG